MNNLNIVKRCKECGSGFLKQDEYISHVKSHFTSIKVKKTIDKKIKLATNAKKTIDKKIKLSTCDKKLTYHCSICNKLYCSPASLKTHVYTYHTKKNKPTTELKMNIDQTKEIVPEVVLDAQSEKPETSTELRNNIDQTKEIVPEVFMGAQSEKPETSTKLNENKVKCSVCNKCYVENVFVCFPKCHYQIESLFPKFDNDTKRVCLTCHLKKRSENFTKHKSISGDLKNEQIIAIPFTSEQLPKFSSHSDVIQNLTLTLKPFNCVFCQSTCERLDHFEIHRWLPPLVEQEIVEHPHDRALEQLTLNPKTENCIFCEAACDRLVHSEINSWIIPVKNQ